MEDRIRALIKERFWLGDVDSHSCLSHWVVESQHGQLETGMSHAARIRYFDVHMGSGRLGLLTAMAS
jgi:hypothetical protein